MDRVLPRFLMGPLIFQKTSRLIPNTVSNSWHLQHVKATKKDNREHTTIDQAGFIFALQQERTHVPECRGVRKTWAVLRLQTGQNPRARKFLVQSGVSSLEYGPVQSCGWVLLLPAESQRGEWTAVTCLDLVRCAH